MSHGKFLTATTTINSITTKQRRRGHIKNQTTTTGTITTKLRLPYFLQLLNRHFSLGNRFKLKPMVLFRAAQS